ncbi:MAG: hypothetical protein H6606_11085 [Flavobacteriales bacterium]|nr:hypothetical protein [Flavobacteriales bacterium]
MTFSEFKEALPTVRELIFLHPDGTQVPSHFHITEIGEIGKNFVDCGGTLRSEMKINFQLFVAGDVDHRLASARMRKIVKQCERALQLGNHEIEVEYQTAGTIGKYGLEFDGEAFILTAMETTCLANDACGIPAELMTHQEPCCSPGSTSC